jgi:hypothetical protein
MSLLSESKRIVGDFEYLNSKQLHTQTLNAAGLSNFAEGTDGDVLTWNEGTNSWEPHTPTGGTNVFVSPVTTNADFYPTLASHDHGSLPLNTNLGLIYNPGTQILTVPYIDSIVTNAVDSLNTVNVEVTNDSTTNFSFYPTFVNGTGNRGIQIDSSSFSFNPATDTLTVPNLNGNASTATLATLATNTTNTSNINITNNTATNATFYPTFVAANSGNQILQVDSTTLQFNPATDTLTVPNVQGNASSATNSVNSVNVGITNNTATNNTYYPTFVSANSGNSNVQVDSVTYTYNPSTNTLTVPNVAGTASNATDSVNSANVGVTNNTATNLTYYPTFVAANSGNNSVQVDSVTYTYNPSTNTLTVPNVTGTASNATDAVNTANVGVTNDVATAATMYPTFVANNSGNNNVRVDSTALTYNPSTNTLVSTLFSGNLINVMTINGAAYPPAFAPVTPTGNTLTVDAVYGDDVLAASNPYSVYFKTITAALTKAALLINPALPSGLNVIVNSGTYDEILTIPGGVSLTGAGPQCVVIQKLLVTADTTLITMGLNCRIENFTANLSSSGNYNLTGVNFPSGTSLNAKMRNSVWTVTSTYVGVGNPSIIGVLSAGISTPPTTNYTAANAIQRTTINVLSSSNGVTRGIYVSGANRFAIRDAVVYARGSTAGTGTNIVGAETTNVNAYLELKTSTISGILYDINRTAGDLLLGFTDLRNNKANGNSFSTVVESSNLTFGIVGNLQNNKTEYLVPGTMVHAALPVVPLNIPVTQNMILFSGTVIFTGALISSHTVTFNLFKNASIVPVYSITLVAGQNTVINTSQSVDFNQGESYYATCVTVGNVPAGTFTATVAFY